MTTRERALDWWQGITYRNLLASANIPNFRGRNASSLTGREIEIIWRRCGNAELNSVNFEAKRYGRKIL